MAKTDPLHAKSRLRADGLASNSKSASELHAKERTYKRPFDLAILLLAHLIPLLWPVWVLLWTMIPLAIWLGDRGPVFYRQKRVGKGGRVFTLLKFRTMVPGADQTGPAWTREYDPRITRVGRMLRRTALDELPQVLNILKGDISLVGPKPLATDEYDYLVQHIPGFERRTQVRPGLTGLAQVYNRDDYSATKLSYDLLYIERMSPWLDLKLVALSVRNTFFGQWDRRSGKSPD